MTVASVLLPELSFFIFSMSLFVRDPPRRLSYKHLERNRASERAKFPLNLPVVVRQSFPDILAFADIEQLQLLAVPG